MGQEVEALRGARYLLPRAQYLAPSTLLFSQWVFPCASDRGAQLNLEL